MSDDKPIISISDLLGIGSALNSATADNLTRALTSGVGRLLGPWLLRREFKNQLELIELAEEKLGTSGERDISLSDRASVNARFKALNQQQNKEEVARKTLSLLRDGPLTPNQNDAHLGIDWVDQFWRNAETISDETLQGAWAKALAREISSPGSVSIRALEALRAMSYQELKFLEDLAGIAFRVIDDKGRTKGRNVAILNSAPSGDSWTNQDISTPFWGCNQEKVFQMAPLGLWETDGWGRDIYLEALDVSYVGLGNKIYRVELENKSERAIHLGGGSGISAVGDCLMRVADVSPLKDYEVRLISLYRKLGVHLYPVTSL